MPDINKRRKIISFKKLCFNCIGEGHRTSNCKSQRSCMKCKGHHHTSLCTNETNQQLFATRTGSNNTATGQKLRTTPESEGIYQVVVVKVNGITCRAMLDTVAGSWYMSLTLACELRKPPIQTDYKQI